MPVIERRYQHWTRNGIDWSNWFTWRTFDTLEECKEAFKETKHIKESDKKLKGEYRIIE